MTPRPAGRPETESTDQGGAVERASPGLGALFGGMREGGGHAVLDLGPARPAHLRLLSRYLGQLRFWDITQGATGSSSDQIRSLPANPNAPYDVVLAWDVLDRLQDEERRELIARLADVTSQRARIFFLVNASATARHQTISFTLGESGRLIQSGTGSVLPARPELLPAAVERLLGPFEVQNAFYVRSGWREYLAVKRRQSSIPDPSRG